MVRFDSSEQDLKIKRAEEIEVALEYYRNRKKLKKIITDTIGTLIVGPIILGVIVGLITLFIKFCQICAGWIS